MSENALRVDFPDGSRAYIEWSSYGPDVYLTYESADGATISGGGNRGPSILSGLWVELTEYADEGDATITPISAAEVPRRDE